MLGGVACALLLAGGPGWVLFPASRNSRVGDYESIQDFVRLTYNGRPTLYRWANERSPTATAGLGGAIAYAYDPKFCDEILPRFSERRHAAWLDMYEFVSCDVIKDVMISAFATWSMNNAHVNFIDVTQHCIDNDLWTRMDGERCTSANCVRCSAAEIMISTFDKVNAEDHTGARVVPYELSNRQPEATNGLDADGGEFLYVELQYATDICWYTDQTFCAYFFNAELEGVDVPTLMFTLFILIEVFSGALFIYWLWRIAMSFLHALLNTWDTDDDGVVEAVEVLGAGRAACAALWEVLCTGSLDRAAKKLSGREISALDANVALATTFSHLNMTLVSAVFTLIAFPPIFYTSVFQPCWDCQDFEAAAVHEIGTRQPRRSPAPVRAREPRSPARADAAGSAARFVPSDALRAAPSAHAPAGHILGFDHPDEWNDLNFKSDRDSYNCSNPLQGVSATSAYDADSVLQATLSHQPKTCLTQDDLDGLNFLYPVCDNRIETPTCVSISRNVGWLRLFLTIFSTVFIPAALVLGLKLYCVLVLRCSKSLADRKYAARAVRARVIAPVAMPSSHGHTRPRCPPAATGSRWRGGKRRRGCGCSKARPATRGCRLSCPPRALAPPPRLPSPSRARVPRRRCHPHYRHIRLWMARQWMARGSAPVRPEARTLNLG